MMFEEGKLQRLEDIFDYVTRSTVAGDLGKKRDTLNRLVENVDRFLFRDIRALAELCGLTLHEMLTLVNAQIEKQHNPRNTGYLIIPVNYLSY